MGDYENCVNTILSDYCSCQVERVATVEQAVERLRVTFYDLVIVAGVSSSNDIVALSNAINWTSVETPLVLLQETDFQVVPAQAGVVVTVRGPLTEEKLYRLFRACRINIRTREVADYFAQCQPKTAG